MQINKITVKPINKIKGFQQFIKDNGDIIIDEHNEETDVYVLSAINKDNVSLSNILDNGDVLILRVDFLEEGVSVIRDYVNNEAAKVMFISGKNSSYVSVYYNKSICDGEVKITVSWPAIGGVDTDIAHNFSKAIDVAIDIANEIEAKIAHNENPQLNLNDFEPWKSSKQ